jgi:hypothetical protein
MKDPVLVTFHERREPAVAWAYEFEGFPRGASSLIAQRLEAIPQSDAPLFALVSELCATVEALSTVEPPLLPRAAVPCGCDAAATQRPRDAPLPVFHSPEVVVMKSTFQAHVAPVTSTADVASFMEQLLNEPKIARATHNIRAYRIRAQQSASTTGRGSAGVGGGADVLIADNDDDGEDAAGERLAHLLELMAADNLCVVVSRWFGGTLMGPARFKAILEVAREAIEGGAQHAGWYRGRPA